MPNSHPSSPQYRHCKRAQGADCIGKWSRFIWHIAEYGLLELVAIFAKQYPCHPYHPCSSQNLYHRNVYTSLFWHSKELPSRINRHMIVSRVCISVNQAHTFIQFFTRRIYFAEYVRAEHVFKLEKRSCNGLTCFYEKSRGFSVVRQSG